MNKDEFVSRVADNRRKLIRIARSMLPARDCEDAVQGAILSAWEHLPQLRDECAFDAWLKQILVNQCRQMQRGYKRETDIFNMLAEISANNQEEKVLDQALDILSGEDEKIIRMHHEQGYTLKEMSAHMGKSEDILKMRLYRARKRLRIALISLLMFILLAAVALGAGLINVQWFLLNRRAEPVTMENPVIPEVFEGNYTGEALDISVNDAVWDYEELSLSFVYSIVGMDNKVSIIHKDSIGVDGERFAHIWVDDQILPVNEWAPNKSVRVFSIDDWRLGKSSIPNTQDYLWDGNREIFIDQIMLDSIEPSMYEKIIDENGRLKFSANLVLKDYYSGEEVEKGVATIYVDAPTVDEWREMYEAYYR